MAKLSAQKRLDATMHGQRVLSKFVPYEKLAMFLMRTEKSQSLCLMHKIV